MEEEYRTVGIESTPVSDCPVVGNYVIRTMKHQWVRGPDGKLVDLVEERRIKKQ